MMQTLLDGMAGIFPAFWGVASQFFPYIALVTGMVLALRWFMVGLSIVWRAFFGGK